MAHPSDSNSHSDELDRALVEAANRGDGAAFERLYDRHSGWTMAVAFRLTGDRDTAADVVQDAVLAWLRRFPGFTLTAPVRAYLYPVLRHLAIDRQRQRRRVDALDDGKDLQAEEPPVDVDGTALEAAIARLPFGQREVLLLHFGDGLSLADVATALEIPLGTVKSRLGLGLAALRANERLREGLLGP